MTRSEDISRRRLRRKYLNAEVEPDWQKRRARYLRETGRPPEEFPRQTRSPIWRRRVARRVVKRGPKEDSLRGYVEKFGSLKGFVLEQRGNEEGL